MPKSSFSILKETLSKLNFNYFEFDNQLILNPRCKKIINDFTFEYYFIQWKKEKPGRHNKKSFIKEFRKNPNNFPHIITPEPTSTVTFTEASAGNPLDKSAVIGFFREVKKPDGNYFTDILSRPIEPATPFLDTVKLELKALAETLDKSSVRYATLANHYKDTAIILEFVKFINQLFDYAKKYKVSQIKSGHLIAFVGGMIHYFDKLSKDLIEEGFAITSVGDNPPVLSAVNKLNARISQIADNFVLDLLLPLLDGIDAHIEIHNDMPRLVENEELKKGFIARILDFFVSLFSPRKKKKEAEKSDKFKKPATKPVSEPKPVSRKPQVYVEPRSFKDLYVSLEAFIENIKSDLAPEIGKNGEVTDYRSMFDQFDIPNQNRDLTYTRFIFRGRIPNADPLDARYKDQTIINSTHWLYDHIRNIIGFYKFDNEKIPIDEAARFTDDIRKLFFVSKNEISEERKYASFPQFRINLLRLFSSHETHTKYNGMINNISSLLDKARNEIENAKKETK
jgi:hypothetical protein